MQTGPSGSGVASVLLMPVKLAAELAELIIEP
jgi:hypothetical protein